MSEDETYQQDEGWEEPETNDSEEEEEPQYEESDEEETAGEEEEQEPAEEEEEEEEPEPEHEPEAAEREAPARPRRSYPPPPLPAGLTKEDLQRFAQELDQAPDTATWLERFLPAVVHQVRAQVLAEIRADQWILDRMIDAGMPADLVNEFADEIRYAYSTLPPEQKQGDEVPRMLMGIAIATRFMAEDPEQAIERAYEVIRGTRQAPKRKLPPPTGSPRPTAVVPRGRQRSAVRLTEYEKWLKRKYGYTDEEAREKARKANG